MERKGRDKKLKTAYKSAFEESFVDNYSGWSSTMEDINSSLSAIAKNHKRKKIELFKYDEFCCLAKTVIEEKIDSMDWDMIIQDEVSLSKLNGRRSNRAQTAVRANIIIDRMESEILFRTFERAMRSRIGPKLYSKYRSEIEQHKKLDLVF